MLSLIRFFPADVVYDPIPELPVQPAVWLWIVLILLAAAVLLSLAAGVVLAIVFASRARRRRAAAAARAVPADPSQPGAVPSARPPQGPAV